MLDGTAGAPPPTCQTRVCGGGQWVCFRDALSADEVTRATRFLSERAASSREAFTLIERAAGIDYSDGYEYPAPFSNSKITSGRAGLYRSWCYFVSAKLSRGA